MGKGGKRKFDEHEDGLEGKIVSPSDGPSKVSYTLQRQTIFNISLMKLYNHRPLTEPSLQKTVLINNMLRRIQEELKQEGSLRPAFPASSPRPWRPASPPPRCSRTTTRTRFALPRRQPPPDSRLPPSSRRKRTASPPPWTRSRSSVPHLPPRRPRRPTARKGTPPPAGPARLRDPRGCRTAAGPRTRN